MVEVKVDRVAVVDAPFHLLANQQARVRSLAAPKNIQTSLWSVAGRWGRDKIDFPFNICKVSPIRSKTVGGGSLNFLPRSLSREASYEVGKLFGFRPYIYQLIVP